MEIVEAPKTNMQQKINNSVICWWMRKTFRKAKTSLDEFKVITPNNPLIKNQAVTGMRNLTTPWFILKHQPTIEHSLQYPIELDLVTNFFTLHKSPICD